MNILMIEDDKELCDAVSFRLEQEGFSITACHDGEEGLYYMQESPFDLVILDRMLPHMNGIEVLKEARTRQIRTPILMLTALGELDDRLTGLNGGADDYMVKPFAFEELLARIRCLLRRPAVYQDSVKSISLGDVSFVPETRTLSSWEKTCTLSSREGELMEVFLRNPGQTLPRQLLLSRVWGLETDVEEGNLDNYIHFLRRRLKTVKSTLQIKTVRGVGYQLEVFQ
ncbi:MAG: response regulator transcription factor [Blautia sp.]|uniref:response regulator transcription factor n=1 Tax=Blautia sp. TaxID=1955243 RepID=UPI002E79DD21|nr:response regulator transcription factor [Blautia sp.]MED9883456.1 response regulator transcription factor [Blautia sp.]